VLATHPDQALALLADASPRERAVLGDIKYRTNHAVLHTDPSMLPRNPRAWAAWNFEGARAARGDPVCLHYLINRLQPLPWTRPVVVSLNPVRDIAPRSIAARFDYVHPVLDAAALRAQANVPQLQGRRNTWFCGAWTGYGFHEDGLVSGEFAAQSLLMHHSIDEAAEVFA
jgi:predicted NAD/FAD-binding protein